MTARALVEALAMLVLGALVATIMTFDWKYGPDWTRDLFR